MVFQGAQARSCQFSFACDGSMRRGKEPVAWRNAKAVAARALGGYVMAAVGAATSFHTTGVSPGWSMIRVAQIGSHVFYGGHARPSLIRAVYTPAPDAGRHAEPQPQLILASALTVQPDKLGMGGPVGTPVEPASAPKVEAKSADKTPAEKLAAADKGKAS